MALTENGLSPADIMAMTQGDRNDNGFGSTWTWVFFLFFLLAWGGGGLFGGSSAAQGALTRAELADGLGRQDIFRNQDTILTEVGAFERDAANRWGNIQYEVMKGLNDNRFAQQECCCTTNRNIDAVRYENAKNTCDIVNTNNLNTRDILNNQNAGIQRILDYLAADKIESLRTELQSAHLTIQNMNQTTDLLNTLRPYPTPAYITSSPYTASNIYNAFGGCGTCGN